MTAQERLAAEQRARVLIDRQLTQAGWVLGSSKVVISTIQRVFRALSGDQVPDQDDPDLDSFVPDAPVTVSYNKAFPPETFDLVIVDEAHRSIYGVWQGCWTTSTPT